LRVFDDEDVCVGPVATLAEAAADLVGDTPEPGRSPGLGAQYRKLAAGARPLTDSRASPA